MSNAPRLTRMPVLILSVILMFLLASIAAAQEQAPASEESNAGDAATTNSLTVADQPLGEGDTVVVSEVSAMDPSWVVIQRASADMPGEVVGKAAVPAGISNDVIVVLSKEAPVGAELLAALHIDAGVEGVYEFPVGPDRAVSEGDEPVSERFSITEAGEMAVEETVSSEEEPAAEEEASMEEDAATEEPAVEEEASMEEDAATEEPAVEEEASMEEDAATEEPAVEEEASMEEDAATEEPAVEEEASMEEDAATEEPAVEEEASMEEDAATEEPAVEEEASMEEDAATEEGSMAEDVPGSILDIAAGTEGIKTFVNAVRSSDLLEKLRSEDLYTVFAPNDAAFTELPEGALGELLADPEGKLDPVLRYHVVSGELLSSDMEDGASANTLQGMAVHFSVDGDSIMVNDATIVEADIEAVNGIIHVIDGVLLPPSATDVASGEAVSGDDMAADPGMDEPSEMPATGGSTSTKVIFVIMAIIALGWAGNIVVTRRHQLRETARVGQTA